MVEVNRTRPAERRKQGKTDRLDAYRAARSVLSGEATTDPKNATIEPLGALLVNATPNVRDRYRDLPDAKLVATLARTRPDRLADNDTADTMSALRTLARRHHALDAEIAELEERMSVRATAANPP